MACALPTYVPTLGRAVSASIFVTATPDTPDIFKVVTDCFEEIIRPLYGPQDKALGQIREAEDRTAEVLIEGTVILGIIVYKNELQEEFNSHGITRSLELKTLIVVKPKTNSRKRYGTRLLDRVIEIAKEKFAENIHVTVSEKVPDALAFFKKKDFEVIASFPDKYEEGVTEHLLRLKLSVEKVFPKAA